MHKSHHEGVAHLVVGPIGSAHRKGDLSGRRYWWVTVLKCVGVNCVGSRVYMCRGIFGEEFNCNSRSIVAKGFGRKAWTSEGVKKVKRITETYFTIIKRCYNPKNAAAKYYYFKGIKVCDSWIGENGRINFIQWASDNGYQPGLSIDRLDPSKDYFPENCRWIPIAENVRRRRSLKLTMEIAVQIRELHKTTSLPNSEFYKEQAALYNISIEAIRRVIKNDRWVQ